MPGGFTWIPIYGEIADKLVEWQDHQQELVQFLETLRAKGLVITPLHDRDDQGGRFLLEEIDPFTFMGVFNRGIREDQRLSILAAVKEFMGIASPLPKDFDGIPVLNNQRSWLFDYKTTRKKEDVGRLWKVFQLALGDDPLASPEFMTAFDQALQVRNTNVNLTMGLFWIRPNTFLNLDSTNRQYLKLKLPHGGLTAEFYEKAILSAKSKAGSLPELSYIAWKNLGPPLPVDEYWFVGAWWNDRDPQDQSQRFLDEGIWQNGYEDRYLDDVRAMGVGDRIAMKSSATQRRDLPFAYEGGTVSRMTIKAIGTITANRSDGRTVEVEWDTRFQPKDWYFYTYRQTIWHLNKDEEYAKRLIDFTFNSVPQDYKWFVERWRKQDPPIQPKPYSVADVVAAGIFLTEEELSQALERLQSKKNLILQGPPGVGKTFLARKLAYALMEEIDNSRIEMVQFHQSYSYEDFIRGYRPLEDAPGTFGLQDGVFYEFCRKAIDDPDKPYIFIIDEINRGNLSQIFGELLMLVEADKRGPEFTLPLVYRKTSEARFYVPANLYLIGLMNLADRSLAMVDYALRRRFAFLTLRPQYDGISFRNWLTERNMDESLVKMVAERLTALNREIAEDPLLGENYEVGHSFFCPKGDDFAGLDRRWYEGIVMTEIVPLLKEYWFDNLNRVDQAMGRLMA